MKKLAIKDLAEQTGVAAGTIRMWEQRYGFPEPARTAGGYRIYTEQDVVTLRRVVAYRDRGLSVPAALERARSLAGATDRPSIFAALTSGDAPVRPQRLGKPTLVAISRAIEEEALARAAGPVVIGAFQRERNYRAVEHRYRRLAHVADAVGVYATFAAFKLASDDEPAELAGGGDRRARARMGGDRRRARLRRLPGRLGAARVGARRARVRGAVDDGTGRRPLRRAVGAALAAPQAPEWSERLLTILADRPLAVESPAPGLIALTNRMLRYLDATGEGIRSTARLRIRPVTVKPIWVSSPAARIVVVTSSVPFGAPIGRGRGASDAPWVLSGGEAERTACGP